MLFNKKKKKQCFSRVDGTCHFKRLFYKNLCQDKIGLSDRLWYTQIISSNLREFEQVIVRCHSWDSSDQIKIGLPNHLFG